MTTLYTATRRAWQCLELDQYLVDEAPGYWGLLPLAGLAALCLEVEQRLYTDEHWSLLTISACERVNLNVAVNTHRPTQVHLHETGCVNAHSTRALYEKLWAAHLGGPPIYMVCGNARYYRNRELTQWLADKTLVQVFLPPYSPNLNLIERLR